MSVEIDGMKSNLVQNLRETVDYVNTKEEMDEIHSLINEMEGPRGYTLQDDNFPVSMERDIAEKGKVVRRERYHDEARFKYVLQLRIEVDDRELIE